jgi:hypothetical protein
MRRFSVLLAVGCLSCSTPGGGSSSSSGGGVADAGAPVRAEDYCEATADVFCPFYLRCGRMAVANAAECHTAFVEACNARYEPRYVALVDAGLLTLSTEGVEACRRHLTTVECAAQPRDLDGPCGGMWLGTQPVGADCGLDVESLVCGTGASCVLGLDFCGSCRVLVAAGGACGGGEGTCGPTGACVNSVCEERVPAGAPCAGGGTCVSGTTCVAGVCLGPTVVTVGAACDQAHRCPYKSQCVASTCVAQVLQGEACGAVSPCASGYCSAGICAAPHANGEACSAPDQCSSGVCSMGLCASLPGHCFTP